MKKLNDNIYKKIHIVYVYNIQKSTDIHMYDNQESWLLILCDWRHACFYIYTLTNRKKNFIILFYLKKCLETYKWLHFYTTYEYI